MVEARGVRISWLTVAVKVSLCCDLIFSSWWTIYSSLPFNLLVTSRMNIEMDGLPR